MCWKMFIIKYIIFFLESCNNHNHHVLFRVCLKDFDTLKMFIYSHVLFEKQVSRQCQFILHRRRPTRKNLGSWYSFFRSIIYLLLLTLRLLRFGAAVYPASWSNAESNSSSVKVRNWISLLWNQQCIFGDLKLKPRSLGVLFATQRSF